MINEVVRKKILDSYGIDVINEYLVADDYHIVFCFDVSLREKAEVHVLSGDIGAYGFDRNKPFYVTDVLPYIEYDNPVSYVLGKENYLEYLFDLIATSNHVAEVYFPIKDGEDLIWVVCSLQSIVHDELSNLVYGRVNWISHETPDAIKFYENTYCDMLTKLYSREALKYHLSQAHITDKSYGLYFDIDNFKRINDIFGHKAGDSYLRELGQAFTKLESERTHYYRIGGDEFFVYLIGVTEKQAYKTAMQVIYDVEKLNAHGEQAEVSASIGIVPINGSVDVDEILDLADHVMYHAKAKGKGNISYARDV